jgi:hypothetical protein
MVASIPVDLLEKWLQDLRSILIADARKTKNNLMLNEGMLHGLDQVQHRMETWLGHKKNMERLSLSRKKILLTKNVSLSRGRYKKLEWYGGHFFLTLAWRHGKSEKRGELALEMENTRDLTKTFLVYDGNLTFNRLAELARESGLVGVKNEGNRQEWVEKVWT